MIYESIKMVFKVFKTNKLRTFLTMLGIIIGIFAITIIFAISSATKESVYSELSNLDFSSINVSIYGTYIDDEVVINFPKSELYDLRKEDCIKSISETATYSYKELEKKIYSDEEGEMWNYANTTGVGYDYLSSQNLKLISGRMFTKMDDDNRMPFCIINENVALKMLNSTDVIGEELTINGYKFKVIGIVESYSQSYNYDTYVLNSYAEGYFKSDNSQGMNFYIVPKSQEYREEAVSLIKEKLSEYLSSEEYYVSEDASMYLDEINSVFGIIELVFAGIAGLSLVVGGIGIMNIMLVSVNERIKEIGIRMALGANSGNIKVQFLIEGVALTLISGIIGMILASGAIYLVNMAISNFTEYELALKVDFMVMIKTVIFCGVIGIVFGLYPAKKASELNPIEALRYE